MTRLSFEVAPGTTTRDEEALTAHYRPRLLGLSCWHHTKLRCF